MLAKKVYFDRKQEFVLFKIETLIKKKKKKNISRFSLRMEGTLMKLCPF